MRNDIYQRITDQIVAELEKGVRPWMKPWSTEHLANRVTRSLRHNGVGYQGINVLMLWAEAMAKGYAAPVWMTFKQALVLGGCVRKGEKKAASSSTPIRSPAPKPTMTQTRRPRPKFIT